MSLASLSRGPTLLPPLGLGVTNVTAPVKGTGPQKMGETKMRAFSIGAAEESGFRADLCSANAAAAITGACTAWRKV